MVELGVGEFGAVGGDELGGLNDLVNNIKT
jgi:hypothetical protein